MGDTQCFRFKKQIARHIGVTPEWFSNVLAGAPCSDDMAAKLADITGSKPKVFHGPSAERKAVVERFIERCRLEHLRRSK